MKGVVVRDPPLHMMTGVEIQAEVDSFVLTRVQMKEVLEWMQKLMFPDGYAANLRRGST
jgi:hypothetical protein